MGYTYLTLRAPAVEKTRLSNKGQIVIPKQVRAAHGWEPGLEFVVEDPDSVDQAILWYENNFDFAEADYF